VPPDGSRNAAHKLHQGRPSGQNLRGRGTEGRPAHAGAGTVLFRCDAGPGLGAGHAYRCLAVAEAFRSLGWRCTVATRPGTLEAVPALGRLAQLRLTGDEGAEARDLA